MGISALIVYQGTYSGVLDFMNIKNVENIKNLALRGVQITDKNGVVQFDTIVPGHYAGRVNHVHGKLWSPLLSKSLKSYQISGNPYQRNYPRQ